MSLIKVGISLDSQMNGISSHLERFYIMKNTSEQLIYKRLLLKVLEVKELEMMD